MNESWDHDTVQAPFTPRPALFSLNTPGLPWPEREAAARSSLSLTTHSLERVLTQPSFEFPARYSCSAEGSTSDGIRRTAQVVNTNTNTNSPRVHLCSICLPAALLAVVAEGTCYTRKLRHNPQPVHRKKSRLTLSHAVLGEEEDTKSIPTLHILQASPAARHTIRGIYIPTASHLEHAAFRSPSLAIAAPMTPCRPT